MPPPNSSWGRWTFPLPGFESRGKERGSRIAWTALQMQWEKEADNKRITQITRPEIVLDFINSSPGLSIKCHEYPELLAYYAPQLTIKGFGGEFEVDFDGMLKTSVAKHQIESNKGSKIGSALTINKLSPACSEQISLRHPTFGDYEPSFIACNYVQGDLGGPEVKYYETFEYLVWFLTDDSNWLPKKIYKYLKQGMKEWAVWLPIRYEDTESEAFYAAILNAESLKTFKLTQKVKNSLLLCIKKALKKISINEKPEIIMRRFIEEDVISDFFRKRNKKNKDGRL